LRVLDRWAWATRDINPLDMYMFDPEPFAEGLSGHPPDYLAICHCGHGVNSYALSYFLVDGPLAVYAQIGWGGAYMDMDRSSRAVGACFEKLSRLLEHRHHARRDVEGRAVVFFSDLRWISAAGWLDVVVPEDLDQHRK
jgi:hypothetical protein